MEYNGFEIHDIHRITMTIGKDYVYTVQDTNDESILVDRLEEIEQWCENNLSGHWGRLQYITDVWYWFNIPSEASLFKMTWC